MMYVDSSGGDDKAHFTPLKHIFAEHPVQQLEEGSPQNVCCASPIGKDPTVSYSPEAISNTKISTSPSTVRLSSSTVDAALKAIETLLQTDNPHDKGQGIVYTSPKQFSSNIVHIKDALPNPHDVDPIRVLIPQKQQLEGHIKTTNDEGPVISNLPGPCAEPDDSDCKAFLVCYGHNRSEIYIRPVICAKNDTRFKDYACQVTSQDLSREAMRFSIKECACQVTTQDLSGEAVHTRFKECACQVTAQDLSGEAVHTRFKECACQVTAQDLSGEAVHTRFKECACQVTAQDLSGEVVHTRFKECACQVTAQDLSGETVRTRFKDCACQVTTQDLSGEAVLGAMRYISEISMEHSIDSYTALLEEDEDDEQCRFPEYIPSDSISEYNRKLSRRTCTSPNRMSVIEQVCEISHSACDTCNKKTPENNGLKVAYDAFCVTERNNHHRCPTGDSMSELEYLKFPQEKTSPETSVGALTSLSCATEKPLRNEKKKQKQLEELLCSAFSDEKNSQGQRKLSLTDLNKSESELLEHSVAPSRGQIRISKGWFGTSVTSLPSGSSSSSSRESCCAHPSVSGPDLRLVHSKHPSLTRGFTSNSCRRLHSSARKSCSDEFLCLETALSDSKDAWASLQMLNLTSRATRVSFFSILLIFSCTVNSKKIA
jgi:hypothetical protein